MCTQLVPVLVVHQLGLIIKCTELLIDALTVYMPSCTDHGLHNALTCDSYKPNMMTLQNVIIYYTNKRGQHIYMYVCHVTVPQRFERCRFVESH